MNSKEEETKQYTFSVVTISKEGEILSVDESFSHLFHYSSEEAIGKSLEFILSDQFPSCPGEFHKKYLTEYGKKHKVTGRNKFGKEFALEMTVSEVPTGMGSTLIIVALHLTPPITRSQSAPPSSHTPSSHSSLLPMEVIVNEEKPNKRNSLDIEEEQVSVKLRKLGQETVPQYFIGPYIIESLIDTSAKSSVYRAIHKDTHEMVAVKLKDKMLCDQAEQALREYEIGRRLSHPNIVKYLDCIHTPTDICIITEYCESGNLEAYTRKKQKLSEDEARVFSWQLVDAVNYCHDMNVKHGDIKLPNILIKEGNAKLTDFDASKHAHGERSTFVGTPAYISPEMLLNNTYKGEEADLWGIGVCLFVMVTGKYPFNSLQQTLTGKFTIPEGLSSDCIDLIQCMLHKDSKQRLTIKQVKNHRFLTATKLCRTTQSPQ